MTIIGSPGLDRTSPDQTPRLAYPCRRPAVDTCPYHGRGTPADFTPQGTRTAGGESDGRLGGHGRRDHAATVPAQSTIGLSTCRARALRREIGRRTTPVVRASVDGGTTTRVGQSGSLVW